MSETNELLGGDYSTSPSAPPQQFQSEEFLLVDDKANTLSQNVDSVMSAVADAVNGGKEDISKILGELESSGKLLASNKVISAEADSSTSTKPVAKSVESDTDGKKCLECPYYKLACELVNKTKIPPQVEPYVLWTNPKVTGAIFGTALVILISLASCSLLSVISTTALLALAISGAYRFYLAVIFRIKGTHDDTFEKLSNIDLKVSKDRVQELSRMLETDLNRLLNQFKLIILWDNITVSAISLVVFYFIYCIGSVFNTITLLILALVSLFTLPKVYQVYKKPIDTTLENCFTAVHKVVKQILKKLPFLQKQKKQ